MANIKHGIIDFVSPCGEFKLTFEDDGKVAYAYLKRGHEIVGDVWLYNRCPTPKHPEWKDRRNIPFANSSEYISEQGQLAVPITRDDVKVDWDYDDDRPVAYVYLFKELYGVVGVDDKPGYARFAIKDGPLAKVMVIE